MVWIGSICCKKFKQNMVARTVALIAPVCPFLLRVSCSSETVANGPKREETHQNMCLGSNGVDQKCSLWKILKRHRGTNFCINCISLSRFASSFVEYRNGSKCTQMERKHQTMSLGSNGVDQECSLWKILKRHRGMNFCIYCFNLYRFASSFVEYRNGSICTQTGRNAPKHEFRVQWRGSGAFVV